MNIEWTFGDADDGTHYAIARITGRCERRIWAQVEQRGNVIGFGSCGDVGKEIVEAAVEILRRYTVTGKIWVPEQPERFVELKCVHCEKPVRFKSGSREAKGILVPFCSDSVCEDMFAAGL